MARRGDIDSALSKGKMKRGKYKKRTPKQGKILHVDLDVLYQHGTIIRTKGGYKKDGEGQFAVRKGSKLPKDRYVTYKNKYEVLDFARMNKAGHGKWLTKTKGDIIYGYKSGQKWATGWSFFSIGDGSPLTKEEQRLIGSSNLRVAKQWRAGMIHPATGQTIKWETRIVDGKKSGRYVGMPVDHVRQFVRHGGKTPRMFGLDKIREESKHVVIPAKLLAQKLIAAAYAHKARVNKEGGVFNVFVKMGGDRPRYNKQAVKRFGAKNLYIHGRDANGDKIMLTDQEFSALLRKTANSEARKMREYRRAKREASGKTVTPKYRPFKTWSKSDKNYDFMRKYVVISDAVFEAVRTSALNAQREMMQQLESAIGWHNLTGNAITGFHSGVYLQSDHGVTTSIEGFPSVKGRRATRGKIGGGKQSVERIRRKGKFANAYKNYYYGRWFDNPNKWFARNGDTLVKTSGGFAYDEALNMLNQTYQFPLGKDQMVAAVTFATGVEYTEYLKVDGGGGNILDLAAQIAHDLVLNRINNRLRNVMKKVAKGKM